MILNRKISPKLFAANLATIFAIILLPSFAEASRLPDTLKFGNIAYEKSLERLYRNQAKLILINKAEQPNFIMAELFKQHVSFLDKKGIAVKTDSLPGEPFFIASKTGQWLYLWGRKDANNAYNRIYGEDGQLLFDKNSPLSGNEPSFGIPFEKSSTFLKNDWVNKELQIIDHDGQVSARVQPLGKDFGGNILCASDLDGKQIFFAATYGESTAFICYNDQLVEQHRTNLALNEVVSLVASLDGRFVAMRFFDSGAGWPFVIMSNTGKKLFEIAGPKVTEISGDGNYLVTTDVNSQIRLIETTGWDTILQIDTLSMTGIGYIGDWRSADFSDDSRLLVVLGEGQMAMIDTQNKNWNAVSFPYAFSQAKLINNASGLVITGEMGYVLYRRIK